MMQAAASFNLAFPGETVRVGDQLRQTIEDAIVWAVEGFSDLSAKRFAQVEGEFVRAHGVRARIEEARAAREAALRPTTSRKLTPHMEAQLASAEKMAHHGGRKAKARAENIISHVKSDYARRLEAESVEAHLHGLEALEQLRGAALVDDTATAGKRAERDGLKGLLTIGSINPVQFAAGMRFRKIYEDAQTELRLTAAYGDEMGGADGEIDADRELRNQIAKHKRQDALAALKVLVVAASLNGFGWSSLCLIAGEGKTINLCSRAGKSSERLSRKNSLITALDTLADNWGLQ